MSNDDKNLRNICRLKERHRECKSYSPCRRYKGLQTRRVKKEMGLENTIMSLGTLKVGETNIITW